MGPIYSARGRKRARSRGIGAVVRGQADPGLAGGPAIIPSDGPVGAASDTVTGWTTGLAGQPAPRLAVGAGVPGALATPAAGIVAICVTSPVTGPVESASEFIEVAGVIIGLLVQSHPIVLLPIRHARVDALTRRTPPEMPQVRN